MKKIIANKFGIAAIEFAIVFPIMLLVIMAVLEFGLYF